MPSDYGTPVPDAEFEKSLVGKDAATVRSSRTLWQLNNRMQPLSGKMSKVITSDIPNIASMFMPYASADMRASQNEFMKQSPGLPDGVQGIKETFLKPMMARPSDLPLVGGLFGKIGDAWNATGEGMVNAVTSIPQAVGAFFDTPEKRVQALQARKTAKPSVGHKPVTAQTSSGSFDTFFDKYLAPVEGGYVAKDGRSGAPANFGINQKANPDIDVKSLTREQAKQLYKERYWIPSGADQLSGPLQAVHMDTAVNFGSTVARELLARSKGDPQVYMQLRGAKYASLNQPENMPAWMSRQKQLSDFAGISGAGIPQFSNPFDPSWGIAAGKLLDAGAREALKPQSITQAFAPPPEIPKPTFAAKKDYTAQDAALAMLKPVELAEAQQQKIRRNSFFQGIAQAMNSIAPEAGLGQILLKLGAGALAGKAAAGNEIQARMDSFDEKMAKYNIAVYNAEAGKADEIHAEAMNEAAALNQYGRDKAIAALGEYHRNNFISSTGDAFTVTKQNTNGSITTTRIPFRAPIMAGLMAAKAGLMQNMGQQQFQGASVVASAENGLIAGITAQEYTAGLNDRNAETNASNERALLELPGYMAGNVVGSGLARSVIGDDKWEKFLKDATLRMQGTPYAQMLGSKEYAETMQQVQSAMLVEIAASGDPAFMQRLFSAGSIADQVVQGDRIAGRKVTTRSNAKGTTTSVTEGN